MQIVRTRLILVMQLAIRPNVHRPAFLLWSSIEPLHHFVLFSLTGVLLEEDRVEKKRTIVHITGLLIGFTAHLHIIILSNDDITIHFLNYRLLCLRHSCRLCLFFAQIFHIQVVIFIAVLVLDTLFCLNFSWIFAFGDHLSLHLFNAPVLTGPMRLGRLKVG